MYKLLLLCCLISQGDLCAQQISSSIEKYVNSPRNREFNGSIMVVYQGKILLDEGRGWQDVLKQKRNNTSTYYRIGSLSKPFTSTLILYLQEQRLLSIQDPISKYLPDYPSGDQITITHLLTHSSGIKEYLEIPFIQKLPDSAKPISIDSLISLFKNYKLSMEPGVKFSYSNSNYILLARIAEIITGEKYEHLIRKHIFQPAQMNHSGFDFKHLANTEKATGHNKEKKVLNRIEDFDSTYAPGCGSMYTTVSDLYHFYSTLMAGNIISDSSREDSFKPRNWKYGYGWISFKLYGKRCVAHPGGVPGFYANLQFYPDDDLLIVILSNSGPTSIEPDRIAGIVFRKRAQSSGL